MRARIRAYGEWASSGAYRRKLPAASFRVLFAVTHYRRDASRLERLKRWCEEADGGNLFWFVGRASLEGDVLEDEAWLVAGEERPARLELSSSPRVVHHLPAGTLLPPNDELMRYEKTNALHPRQSA